VLTFVLKVSFVDILWRLWLHQIELAGEISEVCGEIGIVQAVLEIFVFCFDRDLLSGKHKGQLLFYQSMK